MTTDGWHEGETMDYTVEPDTSQGETLSFTIKVRLHPQQKHSAVARPLTHLDGRTYRAETWATNWAEQSTPPTPCTLEIRADPSRQTYTIYQRLDGDPQEYYLAAARTAPEVITYMRERWGITVE